MTIFENFDILGKISLKSHLSEGEVDMRAGRMKKYNAEVLDKMTLEIIDEEKLPHTQEF